MASACSKCLGCRACLTSLVLTLALEAVGTPTPELCAETVELPQPGSQRAANQAFAACTMREEESPPACRKDGSTSACPAVEQKCTPKTKTRTLPDGSMPGAALLQSLHSKAGSAPDHPPSARPRLVQTPLRVSEDQSSTANPHSVKPLKAAAADPQTGAGRRTAAHARPAPRQAHTSFSARLGLHSMAQPAVEASIEAQDKPNTTQAQEPQPNSTQTPANVSHRPLSTVDIQPPADSRPPAKVKPAVDAKPPAEAGPSLAPRQPVEAGVRPLQPTEVQPQPAGRLGAPSLLALSQRLRVVGGKESLVWIVPMVVVLFILTAASTHHLCGRSKPRPRREEEPLVASRRNSVLSSMRDPGQPSQSPTMEAINGPVMLQRQQQGPVPRLSLTSQPRHTISDARAPSTKTSLRPLRQEPSQHLCLELVVPADNECTLLLPRVRPNGQNTSDIINVDDARGVAVFHATFLWHFGDRPRQGTGKCLVLRSAVDDIVFAFCRDTDTDPNKANLRFPGLSIFHASELPFGELRRDGPEEHTGYSIRTRTGWLIYFRGDPRLGHMNATDESGRLMAMTEATGSQRSVRIGPQVDAGLITLAMLGIDYLEWEASMIKRDRHT